MRKGIFRKRLREMGACDWATKWVGNKTAYKAWMTCKMAGWILWFLCEIGVGYKIYDELYDLWYDHTEEEALAMIRKRITWPKVKKLMAAYWKKKGWKPLY